MGKKKQTPKPKTVCQPLTGIFKGNFSRGDIDHRIFVHLLPLWPDPVGTGSFSVPGGWASSASLVCTARTCSSPSVLVLGYQQPFCPAPCFGGSGPSETGSTWQLSSSLPTHLPSASVSTFLFVSTAISGLASIFATRLVGPEWQDSNPSSTKLFQSLGNYLRAVSIVSLSLNWGWW